MHPLDDHALWSAHDQIPVRCLRSMLQKNCAPEYEEQEKNSCPTHNLQLMIMRHLSSSWFLPATPVSSAADTRCGPRLLEASQNGASYHFIPFASFFTSCNDLSPDHSFKHCSIDVEGENHVDVRSGRYGVVAASSQDCNRDRYLVSWSLLTEL